MMNPSDRERTYRDAEDGSRVAPSGGSGMLWLISIIIAVVGLILMAKNSTSSLVVVPIGISLFFMVMFWVSHRREAHAIAARRRLNQAGFAAQRLEAPDHDAAHFVNAGAPYSVFKQSEPNVPSTDTNLRRVFDRYDLKVISHGRDWGWDAKEIASFLDYARDYVDTQHAAELMRNDEKGELERHLDAAIERALLQHDIEHPDSPKRKKPGYDGYVSRYSDDEGVPF